MKKLLLETVFLIALFAIAPAGVVFTLYVMGVQQQAEERAEAVEKRIEALNQALRGN